jgi:ribosome maturation factor RimP
VKLTESWVQSVIDDRFDDVELVTLEDVGNRRRRIIRLYVDVPGGVDHDLLTQVSHAVGAALDEARVAEGPYTLEVSSPGLERPLTKPRHFADRVGQKVWIRTAEPVAGKKVWQGVLRAADETGVLVTEGDEEVRIGFDNVAKAHLVYEFE